MKINCAKNGACTNNRYRFSCEGDTCGGGDGATTAAGDIIEKLSEFLTMPNGAQNFQNFLHDAKLEGTCSNISHDAKPEAQNVQNFKR
jgi:hypothetical protein